MERSDAEVLAALRERMPDLYFVNTPLTRMRRDLANLDNLATQNHILDFHREPGALLTELTLCAYDATTPGLLAKVSGCLLALDINIHTAFIYTLPAAEESSGENVASRVVLDTLFLGESYRRHSRPLSLDGERRTREELTRLLQQTDTALPKRARRLPEPPLEIFEFTAHNTSTHTVITMAAADHPGILHRVTSALAAMNLNICQGQVNTFEASVDDIFYVTDLDGQPLPTASLPRLEPRLRTLVQQSA